MLYLKSTYSFVLRNGTILVLFYLDPKLGGYVFKELLKINNKR